MSTIPALTDWTGQTIIGGNLIDTDTDAIRNVIDGNIDATNLAALGSKGFKLSQQREPCGKLAVSVPLPDLSATAEKSPIAFRMWTMIPVNAHLSRVSASWASISVATNNTYMSLDLVVAGIPIPVSRIPADPDSLGGGETIVRLTNDHKTHTIPGAPGIPAYQPIPVDFNLDFDGDTLTVIGLRATLEFNAEHT